MDLKRKEKLRCRHIKYILRGKQRWHKQLYSEHLLSFDQVRYSSDN